MKNLFKILGIITLIAVIGFSVAACKDDDDDTPTGTTPGGTTPGGTTPGGDTSGQTPSGGGELPTGAVTGITVDAALVGTWVGDDENGTLVFTSTGVGTTTPGYNTGAGVFVLALNQLGSGTITISDDAVTVTISGTPVNMFTYTISSTTLTIGDAYSGEDFFTGTKQ